MTLLTKSGIPTTYSGTAFRSRLEARWAAFFDLVGWTWVYEPFDATGWIPDFLIKGRRGFLVEVGPCVSKDDYLAKAEKPARFFELPTLVVGVDVQLGDWDEAGVLVNEFRQHPAAAPAFWQSCAECEGIAIYSDGNCHYPCGHRETRRMVALENLWRRAGNEVQWRP